eukprot:CAMPEP_0114530828 /NCGR_PEP_ID=MMETSP0109-20121206/25679_1 /TAXON_ID=29199 /ORGANISM="Chlorarachnion reptans, Strain CCCM449" /LENGTH=88 /DNA_ID=CAMNT_0001713529 /DNA_START=554 /DNA_END=821 /DNA_ORIENTATION=+
MTTNGVSRKMGKRGIRVESCGANGDRPVVVAVAVNVDLRLDFHGGVDVGGGLDVEDWFTFGVSTGERGGYIEKGYAEAEADGDDWSGW